MLLRKSLLISAALHTLLLWGAFASYFPFKERIFFVEIMEPPSEPGAAGPARESASKPAVPPPRQERRQTAEPAPAVPETLPPPLPKDASATVALPAEDVRTGMSLPAGPPMSTSAQPGGLPHAAHQGRPLTGHADSGGGNGEALLSQLRARIERSLVYPPLARKRRMEGAATVSFMVGDGGVPLELRLVQTSGHKLLDEEALSTVRRAAPLPRMTGRIEIPIRFRLSDVQ